MSKLVLVRHGESRWNLQNRFTGWVDVPLSPAGIKEALLAAKKLKTLKFDIAFTSKLLRAQETLLLILSAQDACGMMRHESKKINSKADHFVKNKSQKEIPIYASDKINERYYGDLQGMNKDLARKRFGQEQVHKWRRSYSNAPPNGESLKDVFKRVKPYFEKNILTQLKNKKNVLVVAHGNSLRAMIKHIESISDKDIPDLELSLGKPIIYNYVRGKLQNMDKKHSFARPLAWQRNK